MGDEEELRARIEAQIASRRAAAPPSKRDWSGRKGHADDPVDAEVAPRSLEPVRPWLSRERASIDPGHPAEDIESNSSIRGPARPWSTRSNTTDSPPPAETLDGPLQPVRPWLHRTAKREPDQTVSTGPPAEAPSGPLQPVRPWLRRTSQPEETVPAAPPTERRGRPEPAPLADLMTPQSQPSVADYDEPLSRRDRRQAKRDLAASEAAAVAAPAPEPSFDEPPAIVAPSEARDDDTAEPQPARVLQEHWAREREALLAERAALVAERELLLAQRATLSGLRESPPGADPEPAVRKRGWFGRRRAAASAPEGNTADSELLRPRHAAMPGQAATPQLEPVSPFESFRTPEVAALPVVEPSTDQPDAVAAAEHFDAPETIDEHIDDAGAADAAGGQDARSGWSRRTLGWLLAPAEQTEQTEQTAQTEQREEPAEPKQVAAVDPEPEPDPEPHLEPDPEPAVEPEPAAMAEPEPERVVVSQGLPPWRLRPDVAPVAAAAVTEPEPEPAVASQGLPPWRRRPDVAPPVTEPVAEAVAAVPVSVTKSTPASEPAAATAAAAEVEPATFTPATDLPRRLAAANAAAMARALATEAYDFPEDDAADEDVAQRRRSPAAFVRPSGPRPAGIAREKEPVAAAPLVTGAAPAKRNFPPAEVDDDEPGPAAAKGHRVTMRGATRLLVTLVIAAVIAILLRTFVVAPYYIPSASMEPTLHGCSGCNNDQVLVDKLSYKMHSIHRGDVVVFHRPDAWDVSEKVLIKRVIGLPGDTLVARNGKVYINGLELAEPYVDKACRSGTTNFSKPVTVPDDQAFVMGDNRCDSSDSRRFGSIPDAKVIGRAFMIIWPFGRLHWL